MEIIKIHKAENSPIGELVTFRALPTKYLDYLDPFLFLNHHGPQVYPPMNSGLPFGPHPHRGIETVTFIIDGDISHKDNGGNENVVTSGGVQWMTAGRGLIHAEVSSAEFKKTGGPLEILQLWLNLPASSKMINPFYKGLQKENIPSIEFDHGKVNVKLISGEMENKKAAFISGIGVHLNLIHFKSGGEFNIDIPAGHAILFYLIRGIMVVNDSEVNSLNLVEFDTSGGKLVIRASVESILLFGHALPLNEPVVFNGPFVMNSENEIAQAYDDYRKGLFGEWHE